MSSNLEQVLSKICETVKAEIRAVTYSDMSGKSISSEARTAVIGALKSIVEQIKTLCNADEKAFFEFYFERTDFEDKLLPLFHLAKLVYPEDVRIGITICKKYRNEKMIADAQIATLYGCKERKARYIIADGKKTLTALLNQFINTDMLLAYEIEQLLLSNEVIKHKIT